MVSKSTVLGAKAGRRLNAEQTCSMQVMLALQSHIMHTSCKHSL